MNHRNRLWSNLPCRTTSILSVVIGEGAGTFALSTIAQNSPQKTEQRRIEFSRDKLICHLSVPEQVRWIRVYGTCDLRKPKTVPHRQRIFGNHFPGMRA